MQQRKTIRQLSLVRQLRFVLFVYWLRICEISEGLAPQASTPLAQKLLYLTGSLSAIILLGFIIIILDAPYAGIAIIMAYSVSVATYAIYSMLRMRLARPQAYWVGE